MLANRIAGNLFDRGSTLDKRKPALDLANEKPALRGFLDPFFGIKRNTVLGWVVFGGLVSLVPLGFGFQWAPLVFVNLLVEGVLGSIVIRLVTAQEVDTASLAKAKLESDETARVLSRLAIVAEKTSNAVIMTDANRKITWVNPGFTKTTGYQLSDVLGKSPGSVLQCSKTDPKTVRYISERLSKLESVRCEILNQGADGSPYWLDLCIDPEFDAQGNHIGFLAIESDITEMFLSKERMEKREALLEKTSELANMGGWELDLETQTLHWSNQVKKIHEVPLDYVPLLETAVDFYAPEARQTISDLVKKSIEDGSSFDVELPLITYTGKKIWVRAIGLAVFQAEGPIRIFGALQDVTDKRQVADELLVAATTDRLTGLPNRATIQSLIETNFCSYRLDVTRGFSVLFIDMDRFKSINDSLGHEVGDMLLLEIGERLRSCLRGSDDPAIFDPRLDLSNPTPARLGGDEFVVLLPGISDAKIAAIIGERILRELSRPYFLKGQEVRSTASIGISSTCEAYVDSSELISDADTAMYEAKIAGKGRVVVFEPEMRVRLQSLLQVENELRTAIDNDEFVLHYQPILDLTTGEVDSCEALIRWNHPTKGLLSPAAFVEVAEENGMIVEIGDWVLRESCRQFVEWQRLDPVNTPKSISVNVSRKQLFAKEFVQRVTEVVRDSQIDPTKLHIEITEYGVMFDVDQAVRSLIELRHLGIKVSLDDFGTGFSSLSCLGELPIDTLKLDRAFIKNMFQSEGALALVRGIVSLSKDLNIQVVAEGIEVHEQLNYLQNLCCEYGQGYMLSRPIPADSMPEYCSLVPRLRLLGKAHTLKLAA